ncbi:unnamed protein product [Phytophthora fragariaefolia]|uniref:Unnamed protein product n=1 Tax=Phytophthora fragariaefolia TaxID=1490495 RepID=A0A9W6X014_9STRA|nr:unnamed protein product [Phytophthora fragariaefolia]
MSPNYVDTVKLVEDNHFNWEYNVRMKLSRKGLMAHIVKPKFDAVRDRSTAQWKTNDLKALGVIAGDVSLTYQMEPGTRFAVHVDRFKELVLQMETIGEALDETRKLVLRLGRLTAEYRMISTVLENTPNMTFAYAIQALSGVEGSDELSSTQGKAFASKKKEFGKRRFIGKCFYSKKSERKESECRKKKADEGRG